MTVWPPAKHTAAVRTATATRTTIICVPLGTYMIHPNTAALLLDMLTVLKDQGEDAAFRHIKEDILKHGKQPEYK